MLDNIPLDNILFLDIETVPQAASYENLDEPMQLLWDKKAIHLKKDIDDTPASIYNRAGIYAEFGKIICISVGFFKSTSTERKFRIKSFYGDNEKQVLLDFAALLSQHFYRPDQLLCAHNGKEFDFPYLSRRMIVNSIKLPAILDTASKKPWEVQHLDTMELWKFGDYKSYTPINLLAHILNIPSPKDDIDGSQVWQVYHIEKNLDRIVTYCQKDVLTVAQLILRYTLRPILHEEDITII